MPRPVRRSGNSSPSPAPRTPRRPGAPLVVKDKVIIGAQGGEWPGRGPIFAVDAKTGQKVWEFLTVAGTPDAEKTWGNESWRTGGGGGWMPGTYDAETNSVWWGTANPAPLYDW